MRPSWAILGYLGVLLSRPVGRCWAVLGPSKSDAKTRLRKPPFLEDVSGEIAIGRVRPVGHETESAPFFERVWDRFLVRYSCSSSSSSPRPSLILLVLQFIRALFVRMFVPPGPHGGYLGCIWERLGSLLGRLEAV